MIPDGRKGGGTITLSGNKFAIAANMYADVPFEVASSLNGWTNCGKVGTTSQRPTGAESGETFVDTTVGYMIVSDGQGNWHNPITGAVV
jgi:hypothetical protein